MKKAINILILSVNNFSSNILFLCQTAQAAIFYKRKAHDLTPDIYVWLCETVVAEF
jgi:hypothetical protein